MQPRALGRQAANPSTNYLQVDASAATVPAADVLQLFDVPAGSLVTIVPDVETAEGGVATADLGWAEDPNGFVDALDLNVATTLAAPAVPVTKFFSAAAVISLTLDNEIDTAILGFYITITKF
jgi:hypothetical protein